MKRDSNNFENDDETTSSDLNSSNGKTQPSNTSNNEPLMNFDKENEEREEVSEEDEFEREMKKFWLKNFITKTLKAAKTNISKSGRNLSVRIKSSDNLLKINSKVEDLSKNLKQMPFLRTKDKFAFVIGVFLLLAYEYFILMAPQYFYLLYTSLLIPLLTIRFFLYHKSKYHYFMLDFCYYHQLLTLLYLYFFPYNNDLFVVYFFLSNGPLAFAIYMWKNMLVFHDLDKTTSLFIHISPPLLSFCLRWYPRVGQFSGNLHDQPMPSLYLGLLVPFIFYIYWQFSYILKTEYMDRHKLTKDENIVTSLRWFTKVKPHPIYRMFKKNATGLIIMISFQAFYTLVTLVPVFLFYKYMWLHGIFLVSIFTAAVWNGSKFYFDTFTENYSKRLEQKWKELNETQHEHSDDSSYTPSSFISIIQFIFFFVLIWMGGLTSLTLSLL